MAIIYKGNDFGKEIEANLSNELRKYAFEIEAYAAALLQEARDFSASIGRPFSGLSFVYSEKIGKTDWQVVLNDEFSDQAAYNIEKGRGAEGIDPETGMPYGEMEGLFILERAVQAVADRHRSELR